MKIKLPKSNIKKYSVAVVMTTLSGFYVYKLMLLLLRFVVSSKLDGAILLFAFVELLVGYSVWKTFTSDDYYRNSESVRWIIIVFITSLVVLDFSIIEFIYEMVDSLFL